MNSFSLTRRHLMHIGALSLSQYVLSGCTSAQTHLSSPKPTSGTAFPLGLQLYTVRELLAEDPRGTLNALARLGYEEVELAGLPPGVSAKELRAMLDDAGLICPAMHVQGDVESQTDIAHAVGAELVILPAAMQLLNDDWSPKKDLDVASYQMLSSYLNKMGKEFGAAGLSFGYHNHAWEMAVVGERRGYDVLLDETDPSLVFMELDLGWTHVGNVDALELFERHPGRFKTCHIKDFNAKGEIVNPGEGVVDLRTQLSHREKAGIKHLFVEHDNSSSPLGTAQQAVNFVHSL